MDQTAPILTFARREKSLTFAMPEGSGGSAELGRRTHRDAHYGGFHGGFTMAQYGLPSGNLT
jgi:hypothetical protein